MTKEGEEDINAHTQSRGSIGTNKDNTAHSESNVCERIPDHRPWVDPMGAYKDAAPELLGELGALLSQYRWSEEGCIPRGLVNILNSGKGPFQGADCAKHTLNLKSDRPAVDKKTQKEVIVESARKPKKKKASAELPFERKVKPRPDLPTRDSSSNARKDRGRQRSQCRKLFDQIHIFHTSHPANISSSIRRLIDVGHGGRNDVDLRG